MLILTQSSDESMLLRTFKTYNTKFFSAAFNLIKHFSNPFSCQVRSMVSDFAVFLTIFTMVIIDFLIGVPSPKLQVPSVFKVNSFQGTWGPPVAS